MQAKTQENLQLDQIKNVLTDLIASQLNVPTQQLESNKSFDSYGLDSFRAAQIINGIEINFGLKISFNFLEKNDSLETLAKSIVSQVEKKRFQEAILSTNKKNLNKGLTGTLNPLNLINEQLLKPIYSNYSLGKSISRVLNKVTVPQIVGTSSAFPTTYYKQEGLTKAFYQSLLNEGLDIDWEEVNRFFTNVTINGRHFALSPYNDLGEKETLEAGLESAEILAEKAISKLLRQTGLTPEDISMVVESTLLPATPSIFPRLINHIPFPTNTKRMSLYGVGCMNGVHGLAKIKDYLKGHPDEAVILISVEIASVLWQGSFQKDLHQYFSKLSSNPDQYEQLIKMTFVTAALFGDGAMALLVVGPNHPLATSSGAIQPQIIDSRSNVVPNTVDLIGVDIMVKNNSIRAIVKPEVPDLLPNAIAETIEPLLAKNNLSLDDISHWILHPGGPKIVEAIENDFGLKDDALSLSWETLKEVGNLSSAHVLYMLNQLINAEKPPSAGEYGLLVAMGPGLSQEAILLRF